MRRRSRSATRPGRRPPRACRPDRARRRPLRRRRRRGRPRSGAPAVVVARPPPPRRAARRRSREAEPIVAGPPRKRCPWLTSPAVRPCSSKGTVRSSTLATIQRTGREKRRPVPSPQRMVFEKRRPSTRRAATSGTSSSSGRPSSVAARRRRSARPPSLAHHQVLHRHALAAGEALGGPGRGPVGRERGLHRRAAHRPGRSAAVLVGQARARAPRSGAAPPTPRAPPPPGPAAASAEATSPGACSRISRQALERQLLAADLEEEVRHGGILRRGGAIISR